ncbi:MAG: HAD family hydrolase [Desulfocapsa sp.]|nr:HAD family hydrolase [Desulfocapsa sp.]
MTLAIFDLDNTLLSGDSDHGWGEFLVRKKLVDETAYKKANEKFYALYKLGKLDIYEYSAFSFRPLMEHSMEQLHELHCEFMKNVIRPMIGEKALSLVEKHRASGHELLVITATNSFITRPIVNAFGIENLLATEPRIVDGRYTNEIDGTPCFHSGKVKRLEHWLSDKELTLNGSFFYSDSHNDLPLMEKVDHPVAVDPDEILLQIAKERSWDIISLID